MKPHHFEFIESDTGATLEGYVVTDLPSYVDTTPTTTSWAGPSSLNAADDFYAGTVVQFITGRNKGQKRDCTDYTGATKTLTFADDWPFAPIAGDRYIIRSSPVELTGGSVTLRWSVDEAAASSASMTIDATVRGRNRVTYTWGASDLADGLLSTQVVVTIGGLVVSSLEPVYFWVGQRLP